MARTIGVVAGLIAMKTADTRSFVATTMERSIAAVSGLAIHDDWSRRNYHGLHQSMTSLDSPSADRGNKVYELSY